MPLLRRTETQATGLFVFLMYLCVYMEEEGLHCQGNKASKERGGGNNLRTVALKVAMFYLTPSPFKNLIVAGLLVATKTVV